MDLPLRVRLLGAFVGVVVLSGALTILAGSFLIKRMVISEAAQSCFFAHQTLHTNPVKNRNSLQQNREKPNFESRCSMSKLKRDGFAPSLTA